MIHISKIPEILRPGNIIALTFVAKDGRKIYIPECVCTSYHTAGETFNIKILSSGEIRKVRKYSIIEINGNEIVI